jgi:UDP-N-acetylglucosamine--N-acetylmuramyl-(pentapeptide) pyrophosphoryl-undecaprenol N-acetylglucosamine transferase
VAAVGVPAVFVPLPIGNGEQALNAGGLVAAGGALLVDDKDFSADWIRDNLIPLLLDKDRLARMAASSEHLGIRDADRRMADLVLDVAASGQDSNKHSRTQHGRKQ